jgi:hypothetical protein
MHSFNKQQMISLASLTTRPLKPRRNSLLCPSNKGLGGPHSRYGLFGKEVTFMHLPGIDRRLSRYIESSKNYLGTIKYLVRYAKILPVSSVGIATAYGLDGPEIKSRRRRDFPHLSRPAQPASSKMCTGSFPGVTCGRGVTLTPHHF